MSLGPLLINKVLNKKFFVALDRSRVMREKSIKIKQCKSINSHFMSF